MFPPIVLYAVTGLRDGTFRAQKARGLYAAFGIVADKRSGLRSAYSLQQILAIAVARQLAKVGPTIEEAVALVAPIAPEFSGWFAAGDRSRLFELVRGEKIGFWRKRGPRPMVRWQLSQVSNRLKVSEALHENGVATIVDVGGIVADVMAMLIKDGLAPSEAVVIAVDSDDPGSDVAAAGASR